MNRAIATTTLSELRTTILTGQGGATTRQAHSALEWALDLLDAEYERGYSEGYSEGWSEGSVNAENNLYDQWGDD